MAGASGGDRRIFLRFKSAGFVLVMGGNEADYENIAFTYRRGQANPRHKSPMKKRRKKSSTRDRYLVIGSHGPGFTSKEEELAVLQEGIIPSFEALEKLEQKGTILAGGLPLGERALVFIMEASSNEEADQILRDLPCWGVFDWEVSPILSFGKRSKEENANVSKIKKSLR